MVGFLGRIIAMMLTYIDSAYTIHSCQLECLLHGAKLFSAFTWKWSIECNSVCIQEKGIPYRSSGTILLQQPSIKFSLMELMAAHHNDIPHIFQQFSFQELGRWAQIEFSSIKQCFSAACTFQTCVNAKPF